MKKILRKSVMTGTAGSLRLKLRKMTLKTLAPKREFGKGDDKGQTIYGCTNETLTCNMSGCVECPASGPCGNKILW